MVPMDPSDKRFPNSMSSQSSFPSINSTRTQFNNKNVNGDGISLNSQQSFVQPNIANPGLSGQMQGQQSSDPLDQQSRLGYYDVEKQLQLLYFYQNKNSNFNSENLEQQMQQQQMLRQQMQQQQMLRQQIQHQMLQQQIQQQMQQQMLQQQLQQQMLQQQMQPNLPLCPPLKIDYEPGMGGQRLQRYIYEQRNRPNDNNIEFWRIFVAEFFTPDAKKKWCVAMYGSDPQATLVFSQDQLQCELCNCIPGNGLVTEVTAEILPSLFQRKYNRGMLEDLLYIDEPREYQNSAGQIIIEYEKAIQESVFIQLRVVREGRLRVVFSPELKICSFEFCVRHHDELIPRSLLIPQVHQLRDVAQMYQASAQDQNRSSNLSIPRLQNICNMFVESTKQVVKALEFPLTNELEYELEYSTYSSSLETAEVVHSMKDLIDYSLETATAPMESLMKFPKRTSTQSVVEQRQQKQPQQQTVVQNSNNDQIEQLNPTNGASMSGNQNSMNPRPQSPITRNAYMHSTYGYAYNNLQ